MSINNKIVFIYNTLKVDRNINSLKECIHKAFDLQLINERERDKLLTLYKSFAKALNMGNSDKELFLLINLLYNIIIKNDNKL